MTETKLAQQFRQADARGQGALSQRLASRINRHSAHRADHRRRKRFQFRRKPTVLADREHQAIMLERSRAAFTSAILVTHPVSGGRLYEAASGLCGHGEREYGFDPGQLGSADVAEIVWIKDHVERGRSRPGDIDFILRLQPRQPTGFNPPPKARYDEAE